MKSSQLVFFNGLFTKKIVCVTSVTNKVVFVTFQTDSIVCVTVLTNKIVCVMILMTVDSTHLLLKFYQYSSAKYTNFQILQSCLRMQASHNLLIINIKETPAFAGVTTFYLVLSYFADL